LPQSGLEKLLKGLKCNFFYFLLLKDNNSYKGNLYILNHYNDYMANGILTCREMEVINKKMNNKRLTQLDSNILTRGVRPKLRQIMSIHADYLLNRLSYNPRYRAIENKIKKLILSNVEYVEAIILIGSVVQTNYGNYNDIDVIIVTKHRIWKKKHERAEIIEKIGKKAEGRDIRLDAQIISKKAFFSSYSNNPSLIYQLKDHKVIYGKIKIPKKIELSKLDLLMKLDWSEPVNKSNGREIYEYIRNLWLVRLLMNKVIDNSRLINEITLELGRDLISKLKENKANKLEKKFATNYLIRLLKETEQEIKEAKWEKIKL